MEKIWILISLVFATGIFAEDVKIDNLEWVVPSYQKNTHQVRDGVIQLEMIKEKPENWVWQIGVLKGNVRLDGYKYISFSARSLDGMNHPLKFFIRRRLAPHDEASFFSVVEVTPEWKTYYLHLTPTSRSGRTLGFFAFTKGTDKCDRELGHGGQLLNIQPVVNDAFTLELKDIRLTNTRPCGNPFVERIVEKVKQHPKFIPYRFKEIIKPDAVKLAGFQIVISPEAGEVERFAAEELAKYLKQVTSSEFPIVKSIPESGNIQLKIRPGGPNERPKPAGGLDEGRRAEGRSKLRFPQSRDYGAAGTRTLNKKMNEGFSSELLDGENLVITGNSPRGLVYAVYDFLEKAAGVRWFAPFDYGEIVPNNPELKVPLFKDESSPDMTYRYSLYCSNGRVAKAVEHRWKMADWAFKNRFNAELLRLPKNQSAEIREFYEKRGSCVWKLENEGHNFHKWIRPDKYFESHPEFFCYDRATGERRAERAQLCTTNPELIAELGKIADDYFERNPDAPFFPLFQEDGSRLWCQCPACLALNPSGDNLVSATENNMNLVNSVCARIRGKHSDKGVFTYAYTVTRKPPTNIPPQSGVWIQYCFSTSNFDKMPWEDDTFLEILNWSRRTNRIMFRTYQYLDFAYTYINEGILINIMRAVNVMKLKGSRQEATESWSGVDAYLMYLGARLAWNPWFDEKAFKDDYFEKLYGAAANPIREYHDLISEILCDRSKYLRQGHIYRPSFPAGDLDKMSSLIVEANKAVAADQRALKAIQPQADLLEFLKAYSNAMKASDAYYKHPSEETYKATMKAIAKSRKLLMKLASKRVLSLYHTRKLDAWRRGLESSWRRNQDFQQIQKRYNILSTLNPWKFKTDPNAKGDQEKWFASDLDDTEWTTIKSGDFWEKQAISDYDGAAWYRSEIKVPQLENGQSIGLYFGGADERAWVYLDDKYIDGHHEGDVAKLWNEPFIVMLPPETKVGKHTLTVKVIDSAGGGGLWKDVYLISRKPSSVTP